MASHSFVYMTFKCWLYFGCLCCFIRAINIKRIDPGSPLNVTWPIQPVPDLDSYDIINITVNNSDVIFSCFPAHTQCDDANMTYSSLHFLLIQEDHQLNETYIADNDVMNTTHNNTVITDVGFEFESVNTTDAGVYSLIMIQGTNITEYTVVIYVYQTPTKPTITGSLELQKVGEQLTLTCSGSEIRSVPVAYRNLSELVYTWYLNNKLTSNKDKRLVIESLSRSDNGVRYRCAVREGESLSRETESETVTIEVAYVGDVRLETTKSDVSCKSDCYPECVYRWLDDGGRVLSNTSQLHPSGHTNGINVTCEASNDYDKDSTSTFIVYTESRKRTVTIVLSSLIAFFCIVLLAASVHLCRHRARGQSAAVLVDKSDQQVAGDVFERYRCHRQISSEHISNPADPYLVATDAQPVYVNVTDADDSVSTGQSVTRSNTNTYERRQRRKVIHTLDLDDYYRQTTA